MEELSELSRNLCQRIHGTDPLSEAEAPCAKRQ